MVQYHPRLAQVSRLTPLLLSPRAFRIKGRRCGCCSTMALACLIACQDVHQSVLDGLLILLGNDFLELGTVDADGDPVVASF